MRFHFQPIILLGAFLAIASCESPKTKPKAKDDKPVAVRPAVTGSLIGRQVAEAEPAKTSREERQAAKEKKKAEAKKKEKKVPKTEEIVTRGGFR